MSPMDAVVPQNQGVRLTPCGAAGEVTGSGYLLETAAAAVLVDFGLFQGLGATAARNASPGPVDPDHLDAVIVTHAHLDHSGRLPLLAALGYRKRVFATPATADLARVLLEDGARLQDADLRADNRRHRRAGEAEEAPLYGIGDVRRLARLIKSLPYGERRRIAPGITARFTDAGHILGSATVELTIEDGGRETVIVFSGDIGPPGQPIIRDPVPPVRADAVVMESTYGDRDHPPRADTVREFIDLVRTALDRGQRVLVPAFAIGRVQTLLFHLAEAVREGRLQDAPVYLDSPMARRATQIYATHQDLYDDETSALIRQRSLRGDLQHMRVIQTARESAALNDSAEPCVIIAGSGMCEGGRIVHHLKHNLWKDGVVVLLVGYMAEGTLGRRLAEGAKRVEIFGEPVAVRAAVHTLSGFSAHAGQRDLVAWLRTIASPELRVILTHGEEGPRAALREKLRGTYGFDRIVCPARGEVLNLAPGAREMDQPPDRTGCSKTR